jgi:hypothetical protein
MEVLMDEEEKRLLDSYSRLSRSNQLIALAQIIAGAEMEENARRIGQGTTKPDAPLFNGTGAVPGPAA